ncbi:hypothetical protein J1N35_009103 [Gossypium stocksii]|uniref:Sieve element occlusion N-terminal domain-containing protein n=1 Tax=Gossypium stocksii TaxID=47602 RepID=A0A9D4AH94_9ROSI|nr:hypothetical protein J1N35_009103 [Gossypium stocksii]
MATPISLSISSLASKSQQLVRNERRMLAASDDGAMMKQIQSTHAPDGRVVDVKPILQVIDNVLHHIIPNIDHAMNGGTGHIDALDDRTNSSAVDDEKKLLEAFEDFKRTIETPQMDNLKILLKIFRKEETYYLLNPDKTKSLRCSYVCAIPNNV